MPERDPKKFDLARASTLDAAEREQYLPASKLVALLELKGGETVLDYGAGTGRLALAAAAAIPRGGSWRSMRAPKCSRTCSAISAAPQTRRLR